MAPGIGLITTVATTLYNYSPAPAALAMLHSAPLPSPGGESPPDLAGSFGAQRKAQQEAEVDDEGEGEGGGAGEASSQGTAKGQSPAAAADEDDGETSVRSVEGVTAADRQTSGYTLGEGDEDEDDENDDEEGGGVMLVQTPYHIVVRNYTLVPVLSFLAVCGVVAALTFGWPPTVHSGGSYPHRPAWREAIFGLAFQSLAHGLRIPLFRLLALVVPSRLLPTTHTAVHTILLETLRYGGLILTLPHLKGDEWRWPDVWVQWEAFNASAWFGLGWGIGEVAVGIWQGYRQISFYRPVLPSREGGVYLSSSGDADEESQILPNGDVGPGDDDDDFDGEEGGKRERRLQEQVFELLAVQKREEAEALLGVPLPNIPSIVSALWRLDSLFLALGLTLILSALYARHEFDNDGSYLVPPHTLPLFAAVAVGHAFVSVGWLVGIKVLGAPATTYASLLIALGSVVAGLLSWGALV